MSRTGRLSGFGCLIVGGTGGIGRATAHRFASEGARVVVTGATAAEVEETLRDLNAPEITGAMLDCRDEAETDRVIAEAAASLGRLDVLFHVAGLSGRRLGDGPLDACTAAGWDGVMEANARGAFLTNRASVRIMSTQERVDGLRGTVVNVGSVLASSPSPDLFGTVAYAASKGAIRSLTLACAARYASDGIRFQLLEPGLIDTPMARRAVTDPVIIEYLTTKQPIRPGPGGPEDVAEAALFLCEPATRFTTGAILRVDGGWSISEGTRS